MITFGEIKLPVHPFIWDYDEDILYPITESKKYKSYCELEFESSCLSIVLDFIDSYDIEYYRIKQSMFKDDNKKAVYVSFHPWYFTKISDSTTMTRTKFNVTLLSGLYTRDSNIIKSNKGGLAINKTNRNDIHVHNTKLSPCRDNSFVLNTSELKENSIVSFITVVICNKLKKCCVTRHDLVIT